MTRLERRRRRQWRAVYLILAAAVITLACVIVWADPWEPKEVERIPHEPQYEMFTAAHVTVIDFPQRPYLRDDIPLDDYTQEVLYHACIEWDVPYELALAVCWRETNYVNLITEYDGNKYYGMMAVQLASAEWYMAQCGVEYLNSAQDRLRVGCCILGNHLDTYGNTHYALMAYNGGAGYADRLIADGVTTTGYSRDVVEYMEELMT